MKNTDDPRGACVVELLLGLSTPGESVKQYHIERALRALCEDSWVDDAIAKLEILP
jgi:hypothetical protein